MPLILWLVGVPLSVVVLLSALCKPMVRIINASLLFLALHAGFIGIVLAFYAL